MRGASSKMPLRSPRGGSTRSRDPKVGCVLRHHPQVTGDRHAAFCRAVEADGFAVIAGEAGTGKSTTLAAVRDAYEASGYRVIGMAWTNAVVQNLEHDGFRNATTIAAELRRHRNRGDAMGRPHGADRR